MTVCLYADSNSVRGAQVIGSVGAQDIYEFPANPGISLHPNTRYAISVSGPGNSLAGRAGTGASLSPGCYCGGATADPFPRTVTAGGAAAARALSFTGITVPPLLLAASEAWFVRRNHPAES